jgi:hypothetical protein
VTNIKATLIFKDGESVVFESVQDLMEYITDNELLSHCNTGENLLKIWNHDSEKFAIDSKHIHMIYIYNVYKAEVRHRETKTFHTYEDFENFMCAMGATRGGIHTGARYGICGSEIVTTKYDCAISGLTPYWEEECY